MFLVPQMNWLVLELQLQVQTLVLILVHLHIPIFLHNFQSALTFYRQAIRHQI